MLVLADFLVGVTPQLYDSSRNQLLQLRFRYLLVASFGLCTTFVHMQLVIETVWLFGLLYGIAVCLASLACPGVGITAYGNQCKSGLPKA